jgi:hypothetical protein
MNDSNARCIGTEMSSAAPYSYYRHGRVAECDMGFDLLNPCEGYSEGAE